MTSLKKSLAVSKALRSIPSSRAPETLLPEVMRRVGLADTYWRLESPLGPVYVAHSKAGISMVSRAKSDADFERSFERLHGRRVYPEKSVPPAAVRARVRQCGAGVARSCASTCADSPSSSARC